MPAKTREIEFLPSSIETIDAAIFEWLKDVMALSTTTNEGFQRTPVLWLSAERAFQAKNNKDLRDTSGRLKLPMIVVNRGAINKDLKKSSSFQAHYAETAKYRGDHKGGTITISKRLNQKKTRDFAISDVIKDLKTGNPTATRPNKKRVYEFITIPVPSFVNVTYSISLRTEYRQQMNDLVTPFISRTGNINAFFVEKDGHKYECSVQPDFAQSDNSASLGEEERSFETKVDLKVIGYLIGDGKNHPRPKITIRENAVEIRLSRERVILGDSRPWAKDNGNYRE